MDNTTVHLFQATVSWTEGSERKSSDEDDILELLATRGGPK